MADLSNEETYIQELGLTQAQISDLKKKLAVWKHRQKKVPGDDCGCFCCLFGSGSCCVLEMKRNEERFL